jgi:hypothetical protein
MLRTVPVRMTFMSRHTTMPEPQVIYAAASLPQAHLLKNLLADEGIVATVSNATLQGGSGVDVVGWATLARVLVAEADAARARAIALEFDRRSVSGNQTEDATAAASPAVLEWPACPRCGRRRTTRCPVCQTAGTDFPAADTPTADPLGFGALATDASPCCGPGGCSLPQDPGAAEALPLAAGALPPLLICPTCDEPFSPAYPRRCEWCNHEFAEGYAVELPQDEPSSLNARVIAVVMAILVLLSAVAIYLAVLFR